MMPRKRSSTKGESKTPIITVSEAEPILETFAAQEVAMVLIRCIWDSRLIVGANRTPTGKRYEFMPGEIQPVNEMDYEFLLSLETKTPGCCGGYGGASTISRQKYFEAVEV